MTIEAYRLQGERASVEEVLTWVRHITLREHKSSEDISDDVIILILATDFESLKEACAKRTSMSYELCGSTKMTLTSAAKYERPAT